MELLGVIIGIALISTFLYCLTEEDEVESLFDREVTRFPNDNSNE